MNAKAHLAMIADMSCVVCRLLHLGPTRPVEVHHLRTGQGAAQKADHRLTVPLCQPHHTGLAGIHGDGRLWKLQMRKADRTAAEMAMLAQTIKDIEKTLDP